MNTSLPATRPTRALSRRRSYRRPGWANLGTVLVEFKKHGWWAKAEANSYTEWVKRYAMELNLGTAVLWRALSAVRFYETVRRLYPDLDLPRLERLSPRVTPDHMELLSKLSRVMSQTEFRAELERVIRGAVTRAQLRDTWRAYRPVLAGRNARGRGLYKPKANPRNRLQIDRLIEARIYKVLSTQRSSWTGTNNPHLYRLLLLGDQFAVPASPAQRTFDAIAALQESPDAPLHIHGFIFTTLGQHSNRRIQLFETSLLACDYTWITTYENVPKEYQVLIPQHTGILVAKENNIQIIRQAQQVRGHTIERETLLRNMLMHVLHSS